LAFANKSSHHNLDYDLSPQFERARNMRADMASLEVICEQLPQLIHHLGDLLTE
jgi:hypothetical protein